MHQTITWTSVGVSLKRIGCFHSGVISQLLPNRLFCMISYKWIIFVELLQCLSWTSALNNLHSNNLWFIVFKLFYSPKAIFKNTQLVNYIQIITSAIRYEHIQILLTCVICRFPLRYIANMQSLVHLKMSLYLLLIYVIKRTGGLIQYTLLVFKIQLAKPNRKVIKFRAQVAMQ